MANEMWPVQLSEKGGAAANLTDGRLKEELENTKYKAPYLQAIPSRHYVSEP